VAAVAGRFPGATVRVDAAATRGCLFDEAAGHDLIHLACHGVFRADNPLYSALRLHDGWLPAVEAIRLPAGGALVTLSACESGLAGVLRGDEVLGLARAFLGAGAAGVVVSLWLAQDVTTAALMARWYEHLTTTGTRPGAALREAQLALMETHPHPYYWAPFVLVGEG
jgi:CHAT domain-containing protein